ncbi:family 43 glycosylhydrolase [Verrucosispora sp. WMMD573]|uniref:family 43 glycosylhydrolase n=1 Tax=Verrucosispora sp. WMMD573 TaxID=3015149 RepID=UPI00248D2E8D|nr:family 43 glycosylhydrolase [Verrucosispora sp. WMMD573]WBB52515.1 family 43 glycosylhydrolase [Verrucosispora sp. WMMD573]
MRLLHPGRKAVARAMTVILGISVVTIVATRPAHAAEIPTGARSLQSVNIADSYLRHADYLGGIAAVSASSSAQAKSDATVTVTPGLAGGAGCVSFQAANGMWLRHRDYRIRLEANAGTGTFLADATFCVRDGSVSGSVRLESANYPGRFLRHRNRELWLDPPTTNPSTFAADSSFRVTTPWVAGSRSPVIKGLYADPNIAHLNGRYYLYPTTDGHNGWSGSRFTAFSSTDLVNWTHHGTILDLGPQISWADDRAWAPTIAYRNNRYYFYFSAATHIGVATSSSPAGPFTDPLGRPLVPAGFRSGQMIDPHVFTDTDGQSYLYWGNGSAYAVRLNADMVSFDPGQVRTFSLPNYREAAFVFRRDNRYYLTYSVDDTRSENYHVEYATGTSPFGPWTHRGTILSKNLNLGIKGPGHQSVVQALGSDTWYIAYHRFAIPAGNGTNREITIDQLRFNVDGTIQPVIPTR